MLGPRGDLAALVVRRVGNSFVTYLSMRRNDWTCNTQKLYFHSLIATMGSDLGENRASKMLPATGRAHRPGPVGSLHCAEDRGSVDEQSAHLRLESSEPGGQRLDLIVLGGVLGMELLNRC